jgi:hypothetical protein
MPVNGASPMTEADFSGSISTNNPRAEARRLIKIETKRRQ